MNDDFTPFGLAVKLKEKGFDYPCIGHYVNNQLYVAHYQNAFHSDNDESVDAPTISQVLKWLRKEKLILIGLSPMQEYGGDEVIEWCSTVYKADKQGGLSWQEEFYYQSYEQAAIAGIEYVLDNLI